jgi:hypothetical protein
MSAFDLLATLNDLNVADHNCYAEWVAREPTMTEIIVSQLGTSKEPFALVDVLLVAVLLAAGAAYMAIELGFARLIARLLGRARGKAQRGEKQQGAD